MCKLNRRVGFIPFIYLQKKALFQCSCSNTCRFKILDYSQYLFQFFFGSLYILKEGKIINNIYKFAPEVAIFVNIPDYVL